jgi:hypothetical protein
MSPWANRLQSIAADHCRMASIIYPDLSGLARPVSHAAANPTSLEAMSDVVAPVCDIAVPLAPQSSTAVDKTAIATPPSKGDENLIATSSQIPGRPIPPRKRGYTRTLTPTLREAHLLALRPPSGEGKPGRKTGAGRISTIKNPAHLRAGE